MGINPKSFISMIRDKFQENNIHVSQILKQEEGRWINTKLGY